jgi:hypothetical protein
MKKRAHPMHVRERRKGHSVGGAEFCTVSAIVDAAPATLKLDETRA